MSFQKISYTYPLIACMLSKQFYISYQEKTDCTTSYLLGGRSVSTEDWLFLFLIKSIFLTTLLGA
jgi:hypothetical protein